MILNDEQKMKRLDRDGMLESIGFLAEQCQEAWQSGKGVNIPRGYKKAKNIVISGMGASALGGYIIQSLYADRLKVPLQVVNNYDLPAYVNKNTLCVFSSYSGKTEEVLEAIIEAQKRKAKIFGLTANGKLSLFLKKNKLPGYIFRPGRFNPCGQPRMGLGYSIVGQLAFFKRCGLIKISDSEIFGVVKLLKNLNKVFGGRGSFSSNLAKKIAKALHGRIPILVGSEFLSGNVHALANQINENAKTFAGYFLISELNHHLMEGLAHPGLNSRALSFVFINSDLYYPGVQRRYRITQEVVKKNKIKIVEYRPRTKTKLLQVFEVLLFGSYLSFYLAMLNKLNPSPVPWVNYFKKRL